MNEVARIDLSGAALLGKLDPVPRFVCIVLLVAIKNGATLLCLVPGGKEYFVGELVNGAFYQMVPLPLFIAPRVSNIFKSMAGLEIADNEETQSARFRLEFGSTHAEGKVVFAPPTPLGVSITVHLSVQLDAAERARQILGEYAEKLGSGFNDDFAIDFVEAST